MKKILVIDDNVGVRSVIGSTLALAGYSVRESRDGREGIQMVISERPDLIICDVKMPGLDGYRTLEAIRKCPGTAAIPFILMTGSMGQNDFRRGMVSGADDYLMKPFTPGELIAAVKSRFARQTDLQAEIAHEAEKRRLKDFRQPAEELAAPTNGIMSVVAARLRPKLAAKKITVPATVSHQPVLCID